MGIVNALKVNLKTVLGRIALQVFPARAKSVAQNIGDTSYGLLDRIIRAGLIRSSRQPEAISRLHHRFWAGSEGVAFAESHDDRYEDWFLSDHVTIVDELEKVIAADKLGYGCLYEIGSGDGQVVNYLSTRLDAIEHFVGIDINDRVVENNNRRYGNARLEFVCANAVDWIHRNCGPRSIFFSNGGVLEYFSETEIAGLLKKITTDFKPSVFVIVEPIADDYDLSIETKSRPYGSEWSFTHNYKHLFESNGFILRYQRESRTGGNRWMLVISQTDSGSRL